MAFNKTPVPQAKIKLVSEAIAEKHYPSLNGLRGVSIIMVVMSHLALSWNKLYLICFDGGLGVNIFFVLSGFLITSLCLKEQKTTGTLSLKSFYIRRILRIFPVAYLYLAVLFVLDLIFHLQIPVFQYLGAAFYVMDLSYFRRNHFTPEVSHYWSLSVEEQFYIVFPFILKKSRAAFYYAVLFIVLVLPLLCWLQEWIKPLNEGVFYLFTHILVKFQSIATGCLLALLAFNKRLDYDWLFRYKVVINIIAIFLIFYLGYDTFYSFKATCVNLIIAALTGYIIVSNIVPARDLIFRILNSSVLSTVGILSYSIYIWQQLFTFGSAKLPKYMVTFPGNVIFMVVISSLSYFFYEKYFLTLKSKFSKLKNKQPIVVPE
jgi:peptidoglycan/LPS O-acetylase OafA/YrhL